MKTKDNLGSKEVVMIETNSDDGLKEEKFYITIECSPAEYKKLAEASSAQKQEIEAYVRDKALKARNRKSSNSEESDTSVNKVQKIKSKTKSQNISTSMVKLQQTENDLYRVVKKRKNNKEELALMKDLQERMEEVWES